MQKTEPNGDSGIQTHLLDSPGALADKLQLLELLETIALSIARTVDVRLATFRLYFVAPLSVGNSCRRAAWPKLARPPTL